MSRSKNMYLGETLNGISNLFIFMSAWEIFHQILCHNTCIGLREHCRYKSQYTVGITRGRDNLFCCQYLIWVTIKVLKKKKKIFWLTADAAALVNCILCRMKKEIIFSNLTNIFNMSLSMTNRVCLDENLLKLIRVVSKYVALTTY